ncbi:hypothetical protein Mro03_47480 [Microbispora rosea subsp. rosea]|nr:hypothetical protein Mro03_47480 [Microbispora rosea subsp. rosea]
MPAVPLPIASAKGCVTTAVQSGSLCDRNHALKGVLDSSVIPASLPVSRRERFTMISKDFRPSPPAPPG